MPSTPPRRVEVETTTNLWKPGTVVRSGIVGCAHTDVGAVRLDGETTVALWHSDRVREARS